MIALFKNAREVIRADRIAAQAGLAYRVKPVPEEYSTECGMCLWVDDRQAEEFKQVMQKNKIDGTYHEEK